MTSEQSLKIPLREGKFAYAKLRGDWNRPLVIFLHGFAANIDRIIPYTASKFLAEHGYSFLRYNAYSAPDDARKLIDTTLEIQTRDLADVIAYARRQGAKTVHVAGHSYGGLTILTAKHLEVDSALLIDPTHPSVEFLKRAAPLPGTNLLRMSAKGLDYLAGRVTADEYEQLDPSQYLPHYHTPSLIVSAAGGPLAKTNREYAQTLNAQTQIKLVEVSGASHTFDTDEHLDQLLAASFNWLQVRMSK